MAQNFFTERDLVFAKIRGFPWWPAKVMHQINKCSIAKLARYKVFFYGTYETAVCKAEDLRHFLRAKSKLGSGRKKNPEFSKALLEVQEEIDYVTKHGENYPPKNQPETQKDIASGEWCMVPASMSTPEQPASTSALNPEGISCKRRASLDVSSYHAALPGLLRSCYVKLNRVHAPTGTITLRPEQLGTEGLSKVRPGPLSLRTRQTGNPDNLTAAQLSIVNVKAEQPGNSLNPSAAQPSLQHVTYDNLRAEEPQMSLTPYIKPGTSARIPPVIYPEASNTETTSLANTEQSVDRVKKKPKFEVRSTSVRPCSISLKLNAVSDYVKALKHPTPLSISLNKSGLNLAEIQDNSCRKCDSYFDSFTDLQEHVLEIHKESLIRRCTTCKMFLTSEAHMQNHLQTCLRVQSHSGKIIKYKCDLCLMCFTSRDVLREHLRENHQGKSDYLQSAADFDHTEILASIKCTLRNKIRQQTDQQLNNVIHCNYCKLDYLPDAYFNKHVGQFPELLPCSCPFCEVDTATYKLCPINYLLHLRGHCSSDEDNGAMAAVECELCGVFIVNRFHEFSHRLNIHYKENKLGSQLETSDLQKCNSVSKVINFDNSDTESTSSEEDFNYVMEVFKCKTKSKVDLKLKSSTELNISSEDLHKSCSTPERVQSASAKEENNFSKYSSSETSEDFGDSCDIMGDLEDNSCDSSDKMTSSSDEEDTQEETNRNNNNSDEKKFVVHCTHCWQDIPAEAYFKSHCQKCSLHFAISCPLCGLKISFKNKKNPEGLSHFEHHFNQRLDTSHCMICDSYFFNPFNRAEHLQSKHYNVRKSLKKRRLSE